MGVLSSDLRDMGYECTERESPFDEDGILWSKGYELVCDQTAIVIDNTTMGTVDTSFRGERQTYKYRNSEKVKLAGGHVSSYDWGSKEEQFFY